MRAAFHVVVPFAVLLSALTPHAAWAGRQPAVAARLPAAVARQFDAYCNDGSLPSYSWVPSASADPVKRSSWLIFMKGGGVCDSPERCVARWNDLPNPATGVNDGIDDHEIGDHWTMTSYDPQGNINASRNFDGGGILDFDGVGPAGQQPPAQTNPFDGFNRLYLHYCSSDGWRGRGGEQWVHLSPAQLAYNAGNGPLDADYVEPPPLPGRAGNILFAGANIAEAVFTLLAHSGRTDGGEIVLAGSSGGALGVITNLDAFADILRDAGSTATLYGVVDSVTAVISGDPEVPRGEGAGDFWSGDAAAGLPYAPTLVEWDLAGDQDCRAKVAADPLLATNPFYCASTSNLVLTEVETPFLVAVNSHDVVVHDRLVPIALVNVARDASGGTCDDVLDLMIDAFWAETLTDAELEDGLGAAGYGGLPGCGFSRGDVASMRTQVVPWIRNAITDSVSFIGEGTRVGGLKRFGYYVPNYDGLHQLLAEGTGQRMFYSDWTASVGGTLDPQLGVHHAIVNGNGDGGTTDNHSLADALRQFRAMVLNPALAAPDGSPAPYRVRNDYWTRVVP